MDILNNLNEKIKNVLYQHRAAYRLVGVSHLYELKTEIQEQYKNHLFDEEFYQERLTHFWFDIPGDFPDVRSVLLVTVPQPVLHVHFAWKGLIHPVIVPPTYDQMSDAKIQHQLEQVLAPAGYRLMKARVPEKNLAARGGLMQYGRNNIGYVEGMGSFNRLVAFFTSLPGKEDHWEQPEMMERCLRCKACIKACPTKAIGEERFLLHAERCITFHNEHLKKIPDYVKPSMHHCLIGCMICQQVCPENRPYVDRIEEREHFSEEEASLLLGGARFEELPISTRQKLDRLSLTEDYFVVARNLSLLLH
jgi:epoxyqueuosine reductase